VTKSPLFWDIRLQLQFAHLLANFPMPGGSERVNRLSDMFKTILLMSLVLLKD